MKTILSLILLFTLCGCVPVPAQKPIDTLQVFKTGMGKALDQYIKVCYNDSSEVLARYYTNGKDTIATDAKQEPPKGRVYLFQKKIWVHGEAAPDKFIQWIYYDYKKPEK